MNSRRHHFADPASPRRRRWLPEVVEPHILYPVFALLVLGVIWLTTLYLIRIERAGAENTTAVLSRELISTYEAQAVRAMREIDQTLKFVKYAYEIKGQYATLHDLKTRALLPPDLLFIVSVVDRNGNVVASTRPPPVMNVAGQEHFEMLRAKDILAISRPLRRPGATESTLEFGRRLSAADGSFAGAVMIAVDAAYFVSGYEKSEFGERGVLGILGTDGVFWARRVGDALSAGDKVDYAAQAPDADKDEDDITAPVLVSAWDGVRRYTIARKLYEFPITVIVGLSEDEQMAKSQANARTYMWLAFGSSALVLLFAAALGRMSWQLDTERKRTEQDLRIAAAAFESQEAMMITDANSVIQQVNQAFTKITGYTAADVLGQTPSLLQSGLHDADFYRAMWDSIHHTDGWQGEIWDRRKNGELYPTWLTISAVKDKNGTVTNYIGSHSDITERWKAEAEIEKLAYFDQLTGLPNRLLLQDRLKRLMAASSRSGCYGSLLFIDLDNFKTLNDTQGHDMGDLLLQQVAQRLTDCVREGDTVARLGGDEFVVILTGLHRDEGAAASDVETVAAKILASVNQTYLLGNVSHHCTASIGATLIRDDRISTDELMKQADLAMYKSKASGRNMVHFFDPALEIAVMARANLEDDLRRALAENQFLLHYQPLIEGENNLTGAEAMLRWQHPERGLVLPAEFITTAEESGLILPLGHWVLHTACTQLARWGTRAEMAHLAISVNVSVHQFHQHDFADQVLAVLDSTGANPQRLKLELTESILLANIEEVVKKMSILKKRGVGFALDDFGTGYSSLSYLKRLPLDQLKIDRSFVRDLLVDANDAAIVTTIIALAQSLGLEVIAEGVETQAQWDVLVSAGCHAYQGYFFSEPLPLEDFEEFAVQV